MILDGYVLTVDIAGFAKTFIESGRIARIGMRRLAANDPDHGKRRLLRTRRERPRNGSTATKPNEIAPSHCLPRGSGHGIVPAQTYPGNGPAHVRFGSKADIAAHSSDVRFTPKSRHWDLAATCPLCAKSGHSDVLKFYAKSAQLCACLQEIWPSAPAYKECSVRSKRWNIQAAILEVSLAPRGPHLSVLPA